MLRLSAEQLVYRLKTLDRHRGHHCFGATIRVWGYGYEHADLGFQI